MQPGSLVVSTLIRAVHAVSGRSDPECWGACARSLEGSSLRLLRMGPRETSKPLQARLNRISRGSLASEKAPSFLPDGSCALASTGTPPHDDAAGTCTGCEEKQHQL